MTERFSDGFLIIYSIATAIISAFGLFGLSHFLVYRLTGYQLGMSTLIFDILIGAFMGINIWIISHTDSQKISSEVDTIKSNVKNK